MGPDPELKRMLQALLDRKTEPGTVRLALPEAEAIRTMENHKVRLAAVEAKLSEQQEADAKLNARVETIEDRHKGSVAVANADRLRYGVLVGLLSLVALILGLWVSALKAKELGVAVDPEAPVGAELASDTDSARPHKLTK